MRLKEFRFYKSSVFHYAALAAILLVGLLLRFWRLEAKPLWLDEVLTALFSMGQISIGQNNDIPLNTFFPLTALDQVFNFRAGLSCAQIAQAVVTESVHPPLFFCLMYRWMDWLRPDSEHWVWALRALPALTGVGAIAALYALNRLAFSAAAGLMGAALMAVSPFAVYLSQEARHYTLPILLITLALIGLVQLQQDLMQQRLCPIVWLGWAAINSLSLYVHYFCILALVAQTLALLGWMLGRRDRILRSHWGALAIALSGITVSYLPWIPTLLNHMGRPETDWLNPYKPDWVDRVAPLYQTLLNWVVMVITLPVEKQPAQVSIPSILIMLGFIVWLVWLVSIGFRRLWRDASSHSALQLLAGFVFCVILQFFAIVYLLDKDITVVPRYSFVYYPGICALLGASLTNLPAKRSSQRSFPIGSAQLSVLLVGLLSSLIVVLGLAFQKPYYPSKVAKDMVLEPTIPLETVVSYKSIQEIALGLSFALELRKLYPEATVDSLARFAFLDRSSGYHKAWRTLSQLPQSLASPLNLWVVASPGMRTKNYPNRLRLDSSLAGNSTKTICLVDPDEFHRIGFPYQLFRCQPAKKQ